MEKQEIRPYEIVNECFGKYGIKFVDAVCETIREVNGIFVQDNTSKYIDNQRPIVTTLENIRTMLISKDSWQYYNDIEKNQILNGKELIILIPDNSYKLVEPITGLKVFKNSLKELEFDKQGDLKRYMRYEDSYLTIKNLESDNFIISPFGVVKTEIFEQWKSETLLKSVAIASYLNNLVGKAKEQIEKLEELDKLIEPHEVTEALANMKQKKYKNS